MEPYIVDERVGCVAVYRGPRRNCLSGITDDPDCALFIEGMRRKDAEGNDLGWTVSPLDVSKAHEACNKLNAT